MTAVADLLAHVPRLFVWILSKRTLRNREREVPMDLLREVEALGYTECYLLDSTLRRLPVSGAMSGWPAAGCVNVLALPPTPFGAVTRRRLAPLLAETGALAV